MNTTHVRITREVIDTAALLASMRRAEAGGVTVFEGTVRAETDTSGRVLAALEYSAYEEMAVEQFASLCARAKQTFAILDAEVVHRVGCVPVGEASVVVVVAAAHRAAAIDACRWLIDTLKVDAPIWKKEVWNDGSTSWSDPLSKPHESEVAP